MKFYDVHSTLLQLAQRGQHLQCNMVHDSQLLIYKSNTYSVKLKIQLETQLDYH